MRPAAAMNAMVNLGALEATLSKKDFVRLAALVEDTLGIRMPEAKKPMLEARLRSRLRDRGLTSFEEYCPLVLGPNVDHEELSRLLDQVTTNKTDFFREAAHFEYLVRHALPALLRERGPGHELVVWSAACSTGEEVYTLAMVLTEALAGVPGARFRVIGSDVSHEVLAQAERAVYDEERIAPVPKALRAKYLLQSRDRSSRLVRIAPALRSKVTFEHRNLLDADYRLAERVDVLFCRNVFIYFDRKTQEAVLEHFCRHLAPGAYLFLGHSEAVSVPGLPLRSVATTTYRFRTNEKG